MEKIDIKNFIEQIKLESTYRKFLEKDIIYQLIDIFNIEITKIDYLVTIKNPLKLALQFYKEYNIEYYNMILEGFKNKRIIFQNKEKSFTDTQNNKAYIKLQGNDGDVFILVHELAHYIDRNSNPHIVPDEYWFLSETFAFYVEKKLENWLISDKYNKLIYTIINNRKYFEKRMVIAIKYELYYEDLFNKNGNIFDSDIDLKKIEYIKRFNVSSNIVNNLLEYPLAYILSNYLINNSLLQNDNELVKTCLNTNLYEILNDLFNKNKK